MGGITEHSFLRWCAWRLGWLVHCRGRMRYVRVRDGSNVVMLHVDGDAVQVVEIDSMNRHVSGVRCDAVLS